MRKEAFNAYRVEVWIPHVHEVISNVIERSEALDGVARHHDSVVDDLMIHF